MEKLFIVGLNYSQPNDFFRLPGRRNVEFLTQRGIGELSQYNQNIIFGFSQDLISPAVWRLYGGINLGIYIKPQMTDRISSRFTFGERAFLGFRVIDELVLELYARHFSNGDLTGGNAGQNFIGLSVMWNF
ncbi:MAG: acyloxyacyl hydrolase [Chitinispirillales bacterium]|nr:acyloxyacyl hydrolase [Chitinispirillales bacterium]